jgi:hypothetical protein
LISTVRGSGVEVVIGLAHQTMLALVGLPVALGVADELPLLPHAASVSAEATPSVVSSASLDLPRLPGTGVMVPFPSFSSFSDFGHE